MDHAKRMSEPSDGIVATSKTTEKIIDDSQYTGELLLSSKNLRDLPVTITNYDLSDLGFVDLSWNVLGEIPLFLINFLSLEHLDCHHNFIKCIPQNFSVFEHLVCLDLSHNLLTIYPSHACHFKCLQVLNLSSNKITSLPKEIHLLQSLMEMNLSKNLLSELPAELGNLHSLKSLNVRHNQLTSLNTAITRLPLVKLDISVNKIAKIPLELHTMTTLDDLDVSNNPLSMPPQHVVIKGKQHVMAFLANEHLRQERMKLFSGISRYKINKNGLSSSAVILRSRSQDGQHLSKKLFDSGHKKTKKAMRMMRSENEANSTTASTKDDGDQRISSFLSVDDLSSRRCFDDEDESDVTASRSALECSSDGEILTREPQSPASFASTETLSFHESPDESLASTEEGERPPIGDSKSNGLNGNPLNFYDDIGFIVEDKNENKFSEESDPHGHYFANSELHKRHTKLSNQRREETAKIIQFLADDNLFVGTDTALSPKLKQILESMYDDLSDQDPMLTIRRNVHQFAREKEQVKKLKKILKALLKREFDEDICDSLRDGTLLCELANKILPNSVPNVHTSTKPNEELPEAKRRKNVENFFKVCRKVGLSQEDEWRNILEKLNEDESSPCSESELHPAKESLIQSSLHGGDQFVAIFCLVFFLSTCLCLHLYPLPL